jgi:hypothetical protein
MESRSGRLPTGKGRYRSILPRADLVRPGVGRRKTSLPAGPCGALTAHEKA